MFWAESFSSESDKGMGTKTQVQMNDYQNKCHRSKRWNLGGGVASFQQQVLKRDERRSDKKGKRNAINADKTVNDQRI